MRIPRADRAQLRLTDLKGVSRLLDELPDKPSPRDGLRRVASMLPSVTIALGRARRLTAVHTAPTVWHRRGSTRTSATGSCPTPRAEQHC
jgi:hypothetical protein